MTASRFPGRDRSTALASTDWLWGGFGLTMAGASASFAAYMIATAPAEVTGYGSKDFNIFVQFDRRHPAVAQAERPPSRSAMAGGRPGEPVAVDPEPTGSIRSAAPPPGGKPEAPRGAPVAVDLQEFRLREVIGDKALIEHRQRLSLVQPGSTLEGAGEVLGIERRGDAWVVRTAAGLIGGS